MVYESRVGDVFTLGTSTWRIEDITHDRVLVTPAPGLPGGCRSGRATRWAGPPSWAARSARSSARSSALDARPRRASGSRAAGLDEWAADNLLAYLREQQEATGHVPDDRTIVVERFRDELGDWRVAVHSPFGAPGARARGRWRVAARMRERFGVDVQAMHGDDGIVLRLPDLEFDERRRRERGRAPSSLDADHASTPTTCTTWSPSEIGGSALFAARFRECAARALLLPRRRPDRRQPLWQQRQRAAQLLEVASQYPSFPIVLEAVRECVQDVFDVPGPGRPDARHRARARSRVVEVETQQPSPFARSRCCSATSRSSSTRATRRWPSGGPPRSPLDPTLLAELLGRGEGAGAARPARPRRRRPHRGRAAAARRPSGAARDAEDVADLLRVLGPLPRRRRSWRRCREGTAGDDVEAAGWSSSRAPAG